jgi:hypothetical protein
LLNFCLDFPFELFLFFFDGVHAQVVCGLFVLDVLFHLYFSDDLFVLFRFIFEVGDDLFVLLYFLVEALSFRGEFHAFLFQLFL